MTVLAAHSPSPESAAETDAAAAGSAPPSWLRVAAFVPASGVLAFGSVGLVLAINGWYGPIAVLPLGVAAWLALLALARPALAGPVSAPSRRESHICAAFGVAAIVAIVAWNMANASTHVLIDRDGGSYANTARWIARDGSLVVKPRVGPFAKEPTVTFGSLAVFEMPEGSLQFQFAHMLPVVLAESYAVGGDHALFHAPQLLGGCALLAFFVLAWRLLGRPLFALAAVLALALIIPEVSFSRDAYSEILSQLFLFSALWLAVSPRGLPRWRIALVAGLFLGMLEATRIDSIVFLVGVPIVGAYAWLRADTVRRRRTALASIGALVAGVVPGLALGLADVAGHSGTYYSDLRSDVVALGLTVAASLVASAVAVAAWKYAFPLVRRLPWRQLASGAAVLVAVLGFATWALRPRLQHVGGNGVPIVGLQRMEHVTVDASRVYYERSLVWMSWYLGPLTLAAAIIAAALLVRALLLGRMPHIAGGVAALAPGSVLYLYKAQAVPDHVWVTRRYLLGAFPTLVLLALGLSAWLYHRRPVTRWRRVGRTAALVVAIASVVYPLSTVVGVQSMSEQSGYLDVVHEVCRDIGPHAAVVVLQVDQLELTLPQALRGWCGAEVAVARRPTAEVLHRLARAWNDAGRALFVVASSGDEVRAVVPGAQIHPPRSAVDAKLLAATLTRRPDAYRTEALALVVGRVTPT